MPRHLKLSDARRYKLYSPVGRALVAGRKYGKLAKFLGIQHRSTLVKHLKMLGLYKYSAGEKEVVYETAESFPGGPPVSPTDHPPGTLGKIEVMARRAANGMGLFHPLDAKSYDGSSEFPVQKLPDGFALIQFETAASA